MMDYRTLRETDENVVILPGARVNGDVTFGPGCSVWYNAVIRGDDNPIVFGKNCNIQDNAVFHAGKTVLTVGDNVTVGHGAIVHCVSVGEGTVIGMGPFWCRAPSSERTAPWGPARWSPER